jgi:uncharacterized membrane protein|tara:strand:+ start:817 stop:1095 length:279 start_codon:yes stop_codon:yes gene_type:complete
MTGKGSADTRKNVEKYNEAKYWKLKEIKILAKHLEGDLEGNCIEINNGESLKKNGEKVLDLVHFVEYRSEYFKVKRYTAKKGLITIELKEKK